MRVLVGAGRSMRMPIAPRLHGEPDLAWHGNDVACATCLISSCIPPHAVRSIGRRAGCAKRKDSNANQGLRAEATWQRRPPAISKRRKKFIAKRTCQNACSDEWA